jgi:hypothetical protein
MRLLDDYGEALDRRRWDDLAELFVLEATADWRLAVHRSHAGRKEIVAFIKTAFERFGRTHHQFGNYRAHLDGDRARASCRARNYHALADERLNQYLETIGEYRIDATRTDIGWRITRMELEAFDIIYGTRDQRPDAQRGSAT